MGRPRKDPNREDTTERILRAAAVEFANKGFHAARLSDIADAVGIRRPSLLYHYGSKETLYNKVVENAFMEVRASIAKGLASDGDYTKRLNAVVNSLLSFASDSRSLLALLLRELVDPQKVGRTSVVSEFANVMDGLEAFTKSEAGHLFPQGHSFRQAVLLLVFNQMVRAAAYEHSKKIWGVDDRTEDLAQILLNSNQIPDSE